MLSGGSSQLSFLSGFVSSRISVVVVVVLECGRKLLGNLRWYFPLDAAGRGHTYVVDTMVLGRAGLEYMLNVVAFTLYVT
ncbi:hypothetical protein, partial [Staphylococcus aureus]|uniref:hypothetical protein n=1 Tax=Staphylococcus aureus TaxID=1280 RepID=UPI00301DA529